MVGCLAVIVDFVCAASGGFLHDLGVERVRRYGYTAHHQFVGRCARQRYEDPSQDINDS